MLTGFFCVFLYMHLTDGRSEAEEAEPVCLYIAQSSNAPGHSMIYLVCIMYVCNLIPALSDSTMVKNSH